jgi:hypothetical protein
MRSRELLCMVDLNGRLEIYETVAAIEKERSSLSIAIVGSSKHAKEVSVNSTVE